MEDNNTKEVNLLELISLFFNWLKKTGKSILNFLIYLIQLFFRHKIIAIVTVLIFMACGYYLSRPSSRIYNAEALAMLYGADAQTVREVSKQLENFSKSNNQISLATKLSLPDSVAKNIVSIHSYYVIGYKKDGMAVKVDYNDNYPQKDTLNVKMGDRVYLQLKTKNIKQVPQVQAAILKYFNNNDVLKAQFDTQHNELLQQIHICVIENQRIDSLAKVSYFKDADKQLRFEKDKLLVGEQRKQLFYEELLRLQEIKAGAEMRLTNLTQPIVLPSGFVVNPIPINGRMKYEEMSIIYGCFVALLLSLLIENVDKILKFLNKK
jgi:hypothetical protein